MVFGHGSMAFGFVYTKNHNTMSNDYKTCISYSSSQSCDGGFVLVSASILGVRISGQGYSCRNMVEMVANMVFPVFIVRTISPNGSDQCLMLS